MDYTRCILSYLIFDKTSLGEYPLYDDIFHKLIFVKDNLVVLDITLNRNDVDFIQIYNPVMADNALFDIERTNRKNIVKQIKDKISY